MGDKAKRLLARAFGRAETGMPDLPDRYGRTWRRVEERDFMDGIHRDPDPSPWHKYRRHWKPMRHAGLACWRPGWKYQT